MAIRIRTINGVTVAVCAAMSVEKPGDLYLDDAQHYALTLKFGQDFEYFDSFESVEYGIMEIEQSNNPNREIWDETFGKK